MHDPRVAGEAHDDGEESDGQPDARAQRTFGPYVPPCDQRGGPEHYFGQSMPEHFIVPARLRNKPTALIETVNDWHFAMINDLDRNHFYQNALRTLVKPDSVVLEIGAGSGLLSIMAALAGARKVIAIEANAELAALATRIIESNRMSDRVQVINKMSTDVEPDELDGTPDILVSEILGTLLLGESALHYVEDARERLVAPHAHILPARGTQYVTLIESADVQAITAVRSWEGIDLRAFNELQDTTSLVFTKQYGFRFSSCEHALLSERIPVLQIDFGRDSTASAFPPERRVPFVATRTGVAHALVASWDVSDDAAGSHAMSTDPAATVDNFPRDMQWGQALQLLEDTRGSDEGQPKPLLVTQGEALELIVRYAQDGVSFQCEVVRAGGGGAVGAGRAARKATEAGAPAPKAARSNGPEGWHGRIVVASAAAAGGTASADPAPPAGWAAADGARAQPKRAPRAAAPPQPNGAALANGAAAAFALSPEDFPPLR